MPELSSHQFDPATTLIKHRSLPNVETDRLHARLGWLDSTYFPSLVGQSLNKSEVSQKVGQGASIARELHKRGESLEAYHPRWSSRDALGPKRNLPAR